MGSAEKKIASVLLVVLVGLVVVYFAFPSKRPVVPNAHQMQMGVNQGAAPTAPTAGGAGATATASGPGCATTGGGSGAVATQEFGKKGAKLEIVAALPITHGCHVQTEAELKKAFAQNKDSIHLTIYDLFGPEGQTYVATHGGQRAVIFINGKSSFELGGKSVVLEKQENMTYQPAQLVPLIAQELKKA